MQSEQKHQQEQQQEDEILDNQLRAQIYRLIGQLILNAPSQALVHLLANLELAEHEQKLSHAWQALKQQATIELTQLEQLEHEFFSLFIGVGRGEFLPYASWYQTQLLYEAPLAKVKSHLSQLGFERSSTQHKEPEDHFSLLAEVMAQLIEQQRHQQAQQFFQVHLQPWVQQFTQELINQQSSRFYQCVAQVSQLFLQEEQAKFAKQEIIAVHQTSSIAVELDNTKLFHDASHSSSA